jgi:AcrR family transcriptional regulator
MSTELGLRERKKLKTRELIAGTARRLFSELGFEDVTVAEIAREAEVSEATVFNYFPTKEDLFYYRMEAFEEEMLEAIRKRPAGESVADAFGRFVIEPRGFLASRDERAAAGLREVTRILTASPALLARERAILDRYTATLATLIADERRMAPDAIEPWVIANALIGLHRTLIGYVRREVLAGTDQARIARTVRRDGRRALALLKKGLDPDRLERDRTTRGRRP